MQQLFLTIFLSGLQDWLRLPGPWSTGLAGDPRKKYRFSGEFGSFELAQEPAAPRASGQGLTENGGNVVLF